MKKYLYIMVLAAPCLLQAAVRGAVNQAESGPIAGTIYYAPTGLPKVVNQQPSPVGIPLRPFVDNPVQKAPTSAPAYYMNNMME